MNPLTTPNPHGRDVFSLAGMVGTPTEADLKAVDEGLKRQLRLRRAMVETPVKDTPNGQ